MRSPTCISFDKQEMAQFTAVDMIPDEYMPNCGPLITSLQANTYVKNTTKNFQEYLPGADVRITAEKNEIHLSGAVTQAQKDYYDERHPEDMRYIRLFPKLDEDSNPTGEYYFGVTVQYARDLCHVADCLGTLYICSR